MRKSPAKRKVEEDRVLAIYYKGAMVASSNVDLDRYQMIDLHRDAYIEGRKCGVEVPEYFGFVFCPLGSQKKYDVVMHPIKDPIFGKERECPKLGPPPVELKRGRPPSERRRDKTKKRKVYTRTNTLRCCKCKQFGHNSRSHRENNVLQMRRGKDKPRKPKVGEKRRVGRPSKVDENTLKEVKTTEGTSSQPTTGTPSSS